MIKLIKLLPIIVLLIIGSNSEVKAQCKNFTKKKCMGSLDSYNRNGQYNGAVMFDGEEASLMQTFYSGQEYRLFICAHPSIAEGIFFEVSDYRNNKIYSSEGKNETMFDFNVEIRIRQNSKLSSFIVDVEIQICDISQALLSFEVNAEIKVRDILPPIYNSNNRIYATKGGNTNNLRIYDGSGGDIVFTENKSQNGISGTKFKGGMYTIDYGGGGGGGWGGLTGVRDKKRFHPRSAPHTTLVFVRNIPHLIWRLLLAATCHGPPPVFHVNTRHTRLRLRAS